MPQQLVPLRIFLVIALVLGSLLSKSTAQQPDDAQPQAAAQEDSASASATVTAAATNSTTAAKAFLDGEGPQSIDELRLMESTFAEVAEKVMPATVNIQLGGAQGSGVVVTSDGYILTAAHVIGHPGGKASITFPDGKKYKATTLGVENRIDSGMLKIDEGQADDFPYLEMGLSNELQAGQWVMAVGHPGGIDEDRGLVVRVGRILFESGRVLRTDCTLVGGDSGGPLVDMNGDVVGIHSRIGSQLWNNLHVPVDTYSDNWDRLVQGIVLDGKANLGFSVAESTNKIESVVEKGPAEEAGMKKGDVIQKIGQWPIENRDDIGAAVKELRPFMKIKIVIEREGKEEILDVVVGEW